MSHLNAQHLQRIPFKNKICIIIKIDLKWGAATKM